MDVSNYKFSDQQIERLNCYRDNQDDARLQARFIALLMLAEGIEINKVASIIGKSIKTIENWHRQYRSKGIESLNFFQYKPKQSYLNDEQIELVRRWIKNGAPWPDEKTQKRFREEESQKAQAQATDNARRSACGVPFGFGRCARRGP